MRTTIKTLHLLLSISVVIMFSSCEQTEANRCEPDQVYAPKIVLIAGQSNTHAGLGLDAQLDAEAPNIYQLGRSNFDNCVIIASEPLHHHSSSPDRIGFGLTFAKLLSAYHAHNTDIILVPCGFGGTGFADNRWNKGNDLYIDAVARTNSVRSKYPEGEVVAILWHQGETDVILENQNYQQDLDSFIVGLRADISADSVPFILGGMVPHWVAQDLTRQNFRQLIEQTPQRIGMTGYADPEVPTMITKPDDTFDEIHFDAAGQRELGQRYFQQYLELTE